MLFVPHLKRLGYLEKMHFTLCIIGSRQVVEEDDYGRNGWQVLAPNLTIYGFDADPDACAVANQEFQKRQESWRAQYFPVALWETAGLQTLHLTHPPACSSFFPTNPLQLQRFFEYSFYGPYPQNTVPVETATLDEFCQHHQIESIDFLHLDVQGSELNVLKGAQEMLTKGVLSIKTEVEFVSLYQQQPLFRDIDSFLSEREFSLFDLVVPKGGRVQWRNATMLPQAAQQRMLNWADAYYFQDLISLEQQAAIPAQKLLKLACIADILGFTDYALEILLVLTCKHHQDPRYNVANAILWSLMDIPHLAEQGITQFSTVRRILSYADAAVITAIENVSAAEQSILHSLKLREFNALIVPDWSADEAALSQELLRVLTVLSNHPAREQILLVVYAEDDDRDQAELILSWVSITLLESYAADELAFDISIIGALPPAEWKQVCSRLSVHFNLQHSDRTKSNDLAVEMLSQFHI